MVKRARRFCERQKVYDRRSNKYSCAEYLVEGRDVKCFFSESDIYRVENFREKSQFEIKDHNPRPPNSGDGVCRDFEITPNVRKDLVKKLAPI